MGNGFAARFECSVGSEIRGGLMRDLELHLSDKLITPWGGMPLIKRMLDHLGFEQELADASLPQPCSNRGYRPE